MQTHLGNAMDAIMPERVRYDQNIKELLSDIQILARIVKYTVKEVKELSVDEIMECIDKQSICVSKAEVEPGLTNYGKVQSTQTEDNVLNEGRITFDIRFSLMYNESIRVIINIEAQKATQWNKLHYHLENRIIYYLSRLISSQKETEFFNSDYDDIKKVYSIWICMDAEEGQESVSEISLTSKTLFGQPQLFTQLDKMCGTVIRIRKHIGAVESKNMLIAMLEDILSEEEASKKKKKLEEKYNMVIKYNLEKGVNAMCNLSDIIWEEGLEQGLEQGRSIVIMSCLKNDKTPEEIAEFTGLDIEEVHRIAGIEGKSKTLSQ